MSKLRDLAILGGEPAFSDSEKLHVGRPNIGDRASLLKRIDRLLDTRWLSNSGPLEKEFEQRLAEMVGVKHCVVMCNATVALEIAIRALGLTGEVVVPSFTFIATAHAARWQQVTPVFCDIDPRTHNIDPAQVERVLTPRTTGIIGVHVWGRPCDIDGLAEVAGRHDLKLLFDSAHAFGCSYKGRMIGGFGDAEVFSFHATKFFNTFEGGAVVTNNDELANRMRLMKNFGFAGYDEVVSIGINGKMAEVAAAMGLTNLESLDEFIAVNRRNYELYAEGLRGVAGVKLIEYDRGEENNFQYVVTEVDEAAAGLTRDELMRVLLAENVLARRYFYPGCHRMEPYRSDFPDLHLPETEGLAARVLSLPTGQTVTPDAVGLICDIIRAALGRAGEIRGLGAPPEV
ncbi:MAG: aminotransferase class I/II-fold pyridoxal phosphate-dependent enzyme [Acidobacteria bacterium]|nr:aminotransferase class I/II-fold pyridoxal phosphate-dependent enzyme [Acidobacteriota bacterium]